MKFLVTGGAGFIGSHLVETLLRQKNTVTAIDDLSTGTIENVQHLQENQSFTFLQGSVLDEKLTDQLVKEADVVCHLAAAVGVKYVIDNPIDSIQVNLRGTEHVLASAGRWKTKVFLASTSEVYGKGNGTLFREDDDLLIGPPARSRWSYACSKLMDEFLALSYFKERGLPVVIGRFFNTCGPRQTGRYGMVIPRFVQSALLGKPLQVYGDGSQTRCFAYVGDVVRAVISLLPTPEAEGQVFNIGRTDETRILDLARRIIELTGSPSTIELVPYTEAYGASFEDIQWRAPDTTKIRRTTGWTPQVGLDELLTMVIEHQRAALPTPVGV